MLHLLRFRGAPMLRLLLFETCDASEYGPQTNMSVEDKTKDRDLIYNIVTSLTFLYFYLKKKHEVSRLEQTWIERLSFLTFSIPVKPEALFLCSLVILIPMMLRKPRFKVYSQQTRLCREWKLKYII